MTDRAWTLRAVVDELVPAAFHNIAQDANNRIGADHGRLKARLRPMRGLKRDRSARVIVGGHALVQNLRRGHYELGCDTRSHRRVAVPFTELAESSERKTDCRSLARPAPTECNSARPTERVATPRAPRVAADDGTGDQ